MEMNIMVIGGGGREHAIIKAIRKNPKVKTIWALPGNGGIAEEAKCVPVGAKDLDSILFFARNHQVDFAVVAPDDPLVLGAVDELEALGIPCFGPRKAAAEIEGSKVFAKNLMKKYCIPTAGYAVFSDPGEALSYLDTARIPTVVKADGLALGKGVTVAFTKEEAMAAVRAAMEEQVFGNSGSRIVIEEYLEGPEVSVLAFTDGKTLVPMVSAMDHKRAGDGDSGPNTGGMGAIAPNPFYTPEIAAECMEMIFLPTVKAMNAEGREFRGCLYFGLMLTRDGPKVIEYNCRFGDPETQVVLPLLETDLLEIMLAVSQGRLADCPVRFSDKAACCVILASEGYPGGYETGFPLTLPETGSDEEIYIAGAKLDEGVLVTGGGRVLGASATGGDLARAVSRAYALADRIHFKNAYCRRDIGRKALEAK